MKIQTRPFGEVTIDPTKIISVQGGMFGFEGRERYVLLGSDDQKPFEWLQCVDDPTLAFVVMNPLSFMPAYRLEVAEGDLLAVGARTVRDVVCYIVCVIPDDMRKMTVNLKGPVIINELTRQSRQVISLVDDYTVRHRLFDESAQAAGGKT